MSSHETILVDHDGAVATITLNRPDRMNAATPAMFDEIRAALDTIVQDGARALIITGAGRGFCAGADLVGRSLDGGTPGDNSRRALKEHFNPTILALAALDIPVITAINGAAAGIGCSLALSGDIILGARSSYLLQAFVNIGLVPDGGSSWLLSRAAGLPRAMEAMLLGERIPAERAAELGFITRCVEDEALMDDAKAMARRLADGPTRAMGMIRRLVRDVQTMTLGEALDHEAETQRLAGNTEDFVEGVRGFLEKRKPAFKGR